MQGRTLHSHSGSHLVEYCFVLQVVAVEQEALTVDVAFHQLNGCLRHIPHIHETRSTIGIKGEALVDGMEQSAGAVFPIAGAQNHGRVHYDSLQTFCDAAPNFTLCILLAQGIIAGGGITRPFTRFGDDFIGFAGPAYGGHAAHMQQLSHR